MSLGSNIQFLRKLNKLTQEQFAQKMNISRQTVSKWESGEVKPDLNKLVELCSLFSCSLDELVRKDLTSSNEVYSEIRMEKLPACLAARYVMISPDPENDVQRYMKRWAKKHAIRDLAPKAALVGWDFPFVSTEQKMRFNLHGYVSAWLLPEDFEPAFCGVDYQKIQPAEYAVITVKDPLSQALDRIPTGYQKVFEYLKERGYKEKYGDDILSSFEYEYDRDGVHYMDIYMIAAR